MSLKSKFSCLVALLAGLSLATVVLGESQAEKFIEKRTDVVTSQEEPLTLLGHEIKVGEQAPDFTALNRDMQPVSLSDFAGKVRIITAFPSIDTPVCSMQTRRFNEEAAKLEGVQIFTISADLPFALDRFCATEGIDKAMTLSDHREMEFGRKYGFLIEDMRLLARGTVIVDQEGVVRYVEFVSDLGMEPDYDQAIAVAKELAGDN